MNHFHISTRTLDGAEFADAIEIEKEIASAKFLALTKDIGKYSIRENITIEQVIQSLDDERIGMYAGSPGFVVVLSKCDGPCISATWN